MPTKIWTPESTGIKFSERGSTAILDIPKHTIPNDPDHLFHRDDCLRRDLRLITTERRIMYSIAGIIGLGKSTLPKVMHFYTDAREFNEGTNNITLQLFYHDMFTYAFPLQLELAESRERMIRDAQHSNCSSINDRSFYEDPIYARLLQESGFMSPEQLRVVEQVMKAKINANPHPNVLIWLQGRPSTAFERIQKRDIKYESTGLERPLTTDEIIKLSIKREQFFRLVEKYAPQEVENYKAKHEKAGTPKTMKPDGISLDYLSNLHAKYENELEGVLEDYGFDGVLVKLDVDNADGTDKRINLADRIAMMEAIRNATLLSLYRKGYTIRCDEKGHVLEIAMLK